jgi:hypothetical protein
MVTIRNWPSDLVAGAPLTVISALPLAWPRVSKVGPGSMVMY